MPDQMLMISPHFSYIEMTATQVRGYDNKPTPQALLNLGSVCSVMELVRLLFGSPINVHSGYRSPDVNRVVGGVANSAHKFGLACDFDIGTWGSNRDVWNRLKAKVPEWGIDQLILEYDNWVHIGLAGPGLTDGNGTPVTSPRHMIFTIGC